MISVDRLRELRDAAPKEHKPWRYKVRIITEKEKTFHVHTRTRRLPKYDTRWVRATSKYRAELTAMIVNREVFGRPALGASAEADPPLQEYCYGNDTGNVRIL